MGSWAHTLQELWLTDSVALQHGGSFQTRDWTRVPCFGSHLDLTTGPPGKSHTFLLGVCIFMCPRARGRCISVVSLCDPIDWSLPSSSCPWDSPSKNTGVGCHFLLQEIFLTQVIFPTQVSCIARQIFYHLSHQGSPYLLWMMVKKTGNIPSEGDSLVIISRNV